MEGSRFCFLVGAGLLQVLAGLVSNLMGSKSEHSSKVFGSGVLQEAVALSRDVVLFLPFTAAALDLRGSC